MESGINVGNSNLGTCYKYDQICLCNGFNCQQVRPDKKSITANAIHIIDKLASYGKPGASDVKESLFHMTLESEDNGISGMVILEILWHQIVFFPSISMSRDEV